MPILAAVPNGAAAVVPGLGVIDAAGGKPQRLATLVGRNLIALAKHYTPPLGTRITFSTGYDFISSVIAEQAKVYGDLLIMRLRDTVDEKVRVAEFATLEEINRSNTFLAVGLSGGKVIASAIDRPRTLYATGKNAKFINLEGSKLEPGDSGAPIYVKTGSIWKLLGTNYGITPREFYSNLGALYVSEIPQI